MKKLTCIVCPMGCTLDVEIKSSDNVLSDDLSISGNRCQRGIVYAQEEIRAPKRVVTATMPLAASGISLLNNTDSSVRRIPVKTSSPCLREKIPALLEDIYKVHVNLPVKAGDVIINNWNGEGIDIIATRTFE